MLQAPNFPGKIPVFSWPEKAGSDQINLTEKLISLVFGTDYLRL
jgi:hypothetical protein